MNPFRTRGISLRLALGFALVLVMMVAVAGFGVAQVRVLQAQADQLVAQHMALLDALGRMQENAGERSVLLRDLVLNDSLKAQREVSDKLKANGVQQADLARRFAGLATGGAGSAPQAVQRIVQQTQRTAGVEQKVAQNVADARFDDARQLLAEELTPQQQALGRELRDAFVATMEDANGSVQRNRERGAWIVWLLGTVTAAAVLAGAAVAFVTARAIVRPVAQARQAALRIAAGDLAQPIAAPSRDEVGQLLAALETMRQALAQSVAGIRGAAHRVRSGAQRIQQGSGDLAGRTEEQAASLEESASSMEEFTSTVQQNAHGAREASALAGETTSVATRGGEAVRGVVATMQGIHGASARIGDIIGVIDGIAFQTNILALNAAVEAARAGTHGRGFAVVAGEVRSLAQRSAEAAREIKTLIGDATQRVDGGVRQVEVAGRTMEEIVAAVGRVTGLVNDIAHASAEQLAGIEQVNRALAQMDGNTQRNAALVQETAQSAHDMAQEAERLVQAVAQFKLEEARAQGFAPLHERAPAALAAPLLAA